jgi:hypothetical protein
VAYADLIESLGLIPLGRRRVAGLRKRYAIYLPKDLDDLWGVLHGKGAKFQVYLYPKKELGGMLRGLRVDAFEAKVTRASEDRFLVYLPVSQAPVWEELHAGASRSTSSWTSAGKYSTGGWGDMILARCPMAPRAADPDMGPLPVTPFLPEISSISSEPSVPPSPHKGASGTLPTPGWSISHPPARMDPGSTALPMFPHGRRAPGPGGLGLKTRPSLIGTGIGTNRPKVS